MTKEEKNSPLNEEKVSPTKRGTLYSGEETGKYELSLEAMLKAGVHFGHKKSRWNPKMKGYIFGVRNGVHIIDLEKSLKRMEEAMKFMGEIVEKNEQVLLVGTKKQVKELVKAVGEKAELPYVFERWLGGTFTNFDIIKKRIKYLVDHNELMAKKKLANLTKLERTKLQKKLDAIEEKMGGLVRMNQLPRAVFVLDVIKDEAVIREAKNRGIKTIGLVDTNGDPNSVDYPIPANDDALSSLKYILGVFLKTVMEAKKTTAKEQKK